MNGISVITVCYKTYHRSSLACRRMKATFCEFIILRPIESNVLSNGVHDMKDASDRLSGIFFLLFSGYVCTKGLQLGLGEWHRPGSGFLPFWSGAILGILAMLMLVRSVLKAPSTGAREEKEATNWRPPALVLCALVVYIIFLERLGFIATTALFVGFLLKAIEKKGWLLILWVAVAVALGSYVVFEVLLGSGLPKGVQAIFGV